MAQPVLCDSLDGNEAFAQIHILATTDIRWFCAACFTAAQLAGAAGLPDDMLEAAGLQRIPATIPTQEGGPAETPAARPREEQAVDAEAPGAEDPEATREVAPDAGDPRGDDRVAVGADHGGEPDPGAPAP